MTHDDSSKPADTKWRDAGPGFNPTMNCWFCKLPKATIGSRRVGRLKLLKCAQCLKGADAS